MTVKKNEDYVVRMSDNAYKTGDRSPFGSMSPSGKPYGNGSGGSTLSSSVSKLDNSPMISILAYCASSISMTVVNKYVVSGQHWNVNFLYLAIQVG